MADAYEIIQASGESTLERATKKAQEQIDKLFNVSLNIAVTGETGVGKSMFINAIREIDEDDEGAAETGVVETTSTPTPYSHPNMPNVTYWDLPGIGSQSFKAKTYVKDVKFDTYDFFIIISSARFKENDIHLAKEIRKRKKQFYFVRSKIDLDIQEESKKKSFNKEKTLSMIRDNCRENLKDMGEPKVFLISSTNIGEYDFQALVDTLTSELSEHKRSALLQSLPVSSMAILEEKIKIFKKVTWAAAALSGGIAVAPVPGLSLACDAIILVSFFIKCYYSFGLNDKSIQKLSERVNKPELKDLRRSPLVLALATSSTLRLQLSALAGTAVVEYLCSLVPVVGSAVAATMSFTLTHNLLNNGLDELANTARVILRAAGLE